MEVVKGITMHTIVLVVDKPEKSVSMTTLLNKMGFKTFVTQSMYEALKVIDQEMPHLIISDAILSDGTVGSLFDRLNEHQLLSSTPILALVHSKTKEQLTPLKGRKFAGFLLGKFDPKAFTTKVKEIMALNNDVSPYFIDFENCEKESDLTLSVNASALGKSGDQVIYSSESEIDVDATLVCLPADSARSPALLKMATNVTNSEGIYNIFPLSRIKGKGRKWINELPDIQMVGEESEMGHKKILFYDANAQRFEQFKEVLSGYGMELVHASSIQMASSYLARDPGSFGCVYLDELPPDSGGIQFRENLTKIKDEERPPVIAGTQAQNMRSSGGIQYISKPFGLGVLVDMLESALKSNESVSGEVANLEVSYRAPAKIIGLDETGGILQLKFPMTKGSNVRLEHSFLSELWGGENIVQISDVAKLPGKAGVWQAKFVAGKATGNKAKYWEKIHSAFKSELSETPESA